LLACEDSVPAVAKDLRHIVGAGFLQLAISVPFISLAEVGGDKPTV